MTYDEALEELVARCQNGDVDENDHYRPCNKCFECQIRLAIEYEVNTLAYPNVRTKHQPLERSEKTMGVDIYGIKVKTDGDDIDDSVPYFQRSWWGWRGLWQYVRGSRVVTDDQFQSGGYNCGPLLNRKQTKVLARWLSLQIASGAASRYITSRDKVLASMPNEKCKLCSGTGKREDMEVANGCNGCLGEGTVRPTKCMYRLNMEDVQEFQAFLEKAKGMTIY